MRIDPEKARKILRKQGRLATTDPGSGVWIDRIEKLSKLCETSSLTHIAFLGTALLAKSVSRKSNAYSVKAGDSSPGAYSARSLCHKVLVPESPGLNISLGVTGREPLNNQPYFRIDRVDSSVPVHSTAKEAFSYLIELLGELNDVKNLEEARDALRAFISVRREFLPKYEPLSRDLKEGGATMLADQIATFVSSDSEGGKRAQACAGALLDVYAGAERVRVDRINDPDRHTPGDVSIQKKNESGWERAYEVRDKVIVESDVYSYARKCYEAKTTDVGIIAIASGQTYDEFEAAIDWCAKRGISMQVFFSWRDFVTQVIHWSEAAETDAVMLAVERIHIRLIEGEVSEQGVADWVDRWKREDQ